MPASRNSQSQSKRSSFRLEHLEDRSTPAQFGVPWADPAHLTLSFVPDGTTALGISSTLQSTLNSQMQTPAWKTAILRAVETWSEVANIDVAVVADSGLPFGTAGPIQGDPRFGDIRVGALPMAEDALAEAIPPDPFGAGTLAGDVFLNSQVTFAADQLFGVALHEIGHALGLAPSQDPRSVMFNSFAQNLSLAPSDITVIRALYGARGQDTNEGSRGNGTIKNSTRLSYPVADGTTFTGNLPVVGFGDITTRSDVDVFELNNLAGYTGPITVRVLTGGVSLLAPRVTLTDRNGRVLAQASGTGAEGSNLVLTVATALPGGKLYVRVEAAPGSSFGVGRYGVAATFDQFVRPTAFPLEQVLRGPYESLTYEEIGKLFLDPTGTYFGDDLHQNDVSGTASSLLPVLGYAAGTRYTTTASLSDTSDVDFYRLRSPDSRTNTPFVLTLTAREQFPNGVVPVVQVLDSRDNLLPARILANGNGHYSIQLTGIQPKTAYFVRVAPSSGVGNYILDASFGTVAAQIQTFSQVDLGAGTQQTTTLYVARTQVFNLLLSTVGTAGSGVAFSITNASGQSVLELTAMAGQTTSGVSAFLAPGQYTVTATALGGGTSLRFALQGSVLTDPIGPQSNNSTLTPQYESPTDPTVYVYPNGTQTNDPYLWLPWFFI